MDRRISSQSVYDILGSAINAISDFARELGELACDAIDRRKELEKAVAESGKPARRLDRVLWKTLENNFQDAFDLEKEMIRLEYALCEIQNDAFVPEDDDETDELPF